jgi:hypothetical protein
MRVTRKVHGELMAARRAKRAVAAATAAGHQQDEETKEMRDVPRTRNREWGFFGTCASEGHTDPEAAWDEAMATLTDPKGGYALQAEDARGLLDATWGRHLADQVVGADSISRAITRLGALGWAAAARNFVRKHINPNLARTASPKCEQEIEGIARRILKIETLETRNSDALDFHELAVWTIQEALDAAYEAGRQSATR